MENEKPDRPSQRNVVIRSREKDYDALQAERTIRDFCAFIRSVIARFDENDILTVSTGDNYISFDLEEQIYE